MSPGWMLRRDGQAERVVLARVVLAGLAGLVWVVARLVARFPLQVLAPKTPGMPCTNPVHRPA